MRMSDWSSDVCSSDLGRGLDQVPDYLGLLGPVHPSALDGEVRGQRGQHGKLAGKGIGRGDADLRPRVRRQQQVGLAGRSEERRVGNEWVSTGRSRRSLYLKKKKHIRHNNTQ